MNNMCANKWLQRLEWNKILDVYSSLLWGNWQAMQLVPYIALYLYFYPEYLVCSYQTHILHDCQRGREGDRKSITLFLCDLGMKAFTAFVWEIVENAFTLKDTHTVPPHHPPKVFDFYN